MNNKSDGSREKIFYSCHDLNGVFEEQTLPKGIKTTVNYLQKTLCE
jgi:hypothetical protein